MRTTPRLQAMVTRIAAKHGLDLEQPGAYLRLELERFGYLVIENIGAGRIGVTHYIKVCHDYLVEIRIVLYMADRPTRRWVPLESNELFGGWQLFAELSPQGDLIVYDPEGQAQLAEMSDGQVAHNLEICGWLENARPAMTAVHSGSGEELCARTVRADDVVVQDEWPPDEDDFDPVSESTSDQGDRT